jgi:hypothetical protein
MKKLFLLLMIVPMLSFSQSKDKLDQLLEVYDNVACAYWSIDKETGNPDDILFGGGDFNISSPDVAKVRFYKCDYFEGEFFESAAMVILFDVYSDGTKQLSSIEFRSSKENTFPSIYFNLNRYLGGDD